MANYGYKREGYKKDSIIKTLPEAVAGWDETGLQTENGRSKAFSNKPMKTVNKFLPLEEQNDTESKVYEDFRLATVQYQYSRQWEEIRTAD